MSTKINYTAGVAEPLRIVVKRSGEDADIRGHSFVATFTNATDDNDVITPTVTMVPGMAGIYVDTASLVSEGKRWNYLIVGIDANSNEYRVLDGELSYS